MLLHCEDASLNRRRGDERGLDTATVMGVKGLPREAYEIDVARNCLSVAC